MATEHIITTLESLSCPLCYEPYSRAPRLLRCGHSICQSCIRRFFSATAADFRKECPFCRQISIAHHLNDFPKNFALQSVIESASEVIDRSPEFDRNFDSNMRFEILRLRTQITDLNAEASKAEAAQRDLRQKLMFFQIFAFISASLFLILLLKGGEIDK